MRRTRSTRRAVLAAGTAALGAMAGCVSGTEREANGDGSDGGSGDGAEEDGADGDGTGASEPYDVSMVPVGEVTFESPPERWLAYESDYADMGVALGVGDGLAAVGEPHRYHPEYYAELGIPHVEEPTPLWNDGVDKELFYELDVDVHLVDPNWLEHNGAFGLERADVDEIGENVAPFVGNTIFRRTDEWHDYEYYTLYEAFEKVAEVFDRVDRYEAFAALHEEFLAEIEASLPPADERPDGLLAWVGSDEPEEFYPALIGDEGASTKHFRDLGVGDALADTGVEGLSTDDRGTIDYEAILDVDPDALFLRGHEGKSRAEFEETVLAHMRDHEVASDLAAVREGRVFRGGPIYQGPIYNLFVAERTARECYPQRFDRELFDRERVAEIVAGGA
ncbi:ABC transporter substrate-binding protein [Salinilacihabitans rarus]|uniref:ABC transporter substrate-binding protein n=1 Tax=Salinilacihabitans rarus TaxID=2961596 RepID=UPI0020C8FC9A|nr:ABC transporter substrate-binding protein [Salinilacihabitans rarus]